MSVPGTGPQVLAFDDIVVDFDAHRLCKAGADVALEPKAFAVLRTMLERPGHAFGRDELLDAVWGHRHVTPGVLVRVVGLIRKSLGDDHERYLQTVHGVGYRFVLPAGRAGADVPLPAAALPAVAPVPAARRVLHERRVGPRRHSLARLLALSTLLLVLAVAWSWRDAGAPPTADDDAAPTAAPAAVSPPALLAVLPLRALGDDPRGQDFADGLSEEMITTLARIDGLRVSARSASFRYREAALPLVEVARRLGASHVLEGSVRQDGARLRIALRLVDVAADRAVWSESFDRRVEDLFAVQSEIAQAVAEVLRLRMVLQASPTASEDPALYRRFLLARQLSANAAGNDLVPAAKAEAALRALVADHPDYARAWGALAVLQFDRSVRPRAGNDALLMDAERLAARALALDPAQPDALAVIAGQACREQRWSDCLAQSRRAVRLAPSDVGSRLRLALRQAQMGYVEMGLQELQGALVIHPDSGGLYMAQGRLLDTLGRHDEARVSLARASPARSRTARVLNAFWREDWADARAISLSHPRDDHWRASQLATLDAIADPARWPAALSLIEVSENTASSEGERVSYNFMRMWLPERDYARDVAGLDQTQKAGFSSYQLVFWQPGQGALRQSAPFRTYVRESGLLALWRAEGWLSMCRAEGADDFRCD